MKKPLVALTLLCAACGGSLPLPTASTSSCSTPAQVTFVRDTLRDIYFWYKDLPNPDPASFSSPEAYLEAVRYKPLDTSFSFITGKAADQALISESQFIGIGFSRSQTGEAEIRISQVFPDSPAAEAGLARGDYLLAVNGKAVADLIRTGEINTIFGPNEVGVAVDLAWRSPQGGQRQATIQKRTVTIPTVSGTRVFAVAGLRVGYLHFRNFVTPSNAALDAAFGELRAGGATDLVLDLRYNGGGLLSVAQHLGGLIGGARTNGQVFLELVHNDKNTRRNTTTRFDNPSPALGLPRLVVITTRASASASETIINGLRPFLPVTVVGDATFGKPVGQYSYDFCDKVLYPVAFAVHNARGEGDYFNGIPADCAAGDDLDHPQGDAAEASVAEALHFVQTGTCSAKAAGAGLALARAQARIGVPRPVDGWQQLLNAN